MTTTTNYFLKQALLGDAELQMTLAVAEALRLDSSAVTWLMNECGQWRFA